MKNLKIFNKIFLFTCVFSAGLLYADGDTLTVERSVEIALKNNPQIKIAESNFESTDAGFVSARSVLFPQVSLNSGWVRNGGNFFQGPSVREATYENYSYGFAMNQLLYDFGKSYSKISANSDLKNASLQDLSSAKQTIILNTYTAFYNYLQALRIRDVSKESLKQAEEHLRQAEKFFEVGKKPQFDVLKAKTDAANAKVSLINSENNVVVAKLQFENTLNIKLNNNFVLKDVLEVIKDSVDFASAMNTAIQSRPELISAKYKIEANKSLVSSAWSANLPAISMTGGYNWRTYDLKKSFLDSWNLGVSLSLPIFQGFGLQSGIDQAKANLKNSEAQLEYVNRNIELDVQQQYYSLHLAEAKIEAAKSLLRQAEETLNIAEGRYKQEIGSPIEITDARITLLNSQVIHIQALYDYQIASIRLKKAMGILK